MNALGELEHSLFPACMGSIAAEEPSLQVRDIIARSSSFHKIFGRRMFLVGFFSDLPLLANDPIAGVVPKNYSGVRGRPRRRDHEYDFLGLTTVGRHGSERGKDTRV